jgi:hypothetical protein
MTLGGAEIARRLSPSDTPEIERTERLGRWHMAVRACRVPLGNRLFIAWAARTSDLGTGPMEVDWNEETHFEFGETAEEALCRLRRCLPGD